MCCWFYYPWKKIIELAHLEDIHLGFFFYLAIYKQIKTDKVTKIVSCFYLFAFFLVVHFLFSRQIIKDIKTLEYILMLSSLSWSTNVFTFFNHSISFIFAPNFKPTRNNQCILLHCTMICFLEGVLLSFALFQLTVLSLEPCFLLI